jgi:hypothetical protein
MELSYDRRPVRRFGSVKLDEALDHLPPEVREAARTAATALVDLGIPFAFVGGIAVGAHGHVRQTVDVDFLVGEQAFDHHGSVVTFKPGVPISVGGVRVDYLSASSLGPAVEAGLKEPVISDGFPVVPIEILMYTKLVAGRQKDHGDVVELIKARADVRHVRSWLEMNGSDLLPIWDALVEAAEREQTRT